MTMPNDYKDSIRKALGQGVSQKEIARIFKTSRRTVRRTEFEFQNLSGGVCRVCLKSPRLPRRKACGLCTNKNRRRMLERKSQGFCSACGEVKGSLFGMCDKCRDKYAERAREYAWKSIYERSRKEKEMLNKKNGLCGCGKVLDSGHVNCSKCRRTKNASRRRQKERLKEEAIKAYGGKCYCCGEDNPGLLTIDHVNNDGYILRRNSNLHKHLIYKVVKREGYSPAYRLACFHCNLGRDKEPDKDCPHQKGPFPESNMKVVPLDQYALLA